MFNCVLFVYVLFLSLVRKKKIPKRKYTVCARRATPKPLPAKRRLSERSEFPATQAEIRPE